MNKDNFFESDDDIQSAPYEPLTPFKYLNKVRSKHQTFPEYKRSSPLEEERSSPSTSSTSNETLTPLEEVRLPSTPSTPHESPYEIFTPEEEVSSLPSPDPEYELQTPLRESYDCEIPTSESSTSHSPVPSIPSPLIEPLLPFIPPLPPTPPPPSPPPPPPPPPPPESPGVNYFHQNIPQANLNTPNGTNRALMNEMGRTFEIQAPNGTVYQIPILFRDFHYPNYAMRYLVPTPYPGNVDKAHCFHLLVKHSHSRHPISWRQFSITRSREQAMELIKLYHRLINYGYYSFVDLAKRYSDCYSAKSNGELAPFARGETDRMFEVNVFFLRTGELSEPFETDMGFHIVLRVG